MPKSGYVIAECQKTRFVRLLELAAETLKSGGEALATSLRHDSRRREDRGRRSGRILNKSSPADKSQTVCKRLASRTTCLHGITACGSRRHRRTKYLRRRSARILRPKAWTNRFAPREPSSRSPGPSKLESSS